MKILVTGANGFIGREIVSELFKSSHEIIANGRGDNTNSEFVTSENYYKGDITDENSLSEIKNLKSVDAVVHCAGLAHQFGKVEKKDFWQANVFGTKNIAELTLNLGAKHFILISSVAVYGGNKSENSLVNEDSDCNPEDFYAQSKLESERTAANILTEKGIILNILRPATVIGEGDRGNFLRLIRSIDEKRFVWIGKGSNHKSLIHKNDVARACIDVLERTSDKSNIFNVSAEPLTMKEIVDQIALGLKAQVLPFFMPVGVVRKIFEINSQTFKSKKLETLEKTVNKWTAEDVYSSDKIKKTIGFKSKIAVKDAILREVRWYLENKLSQK